MNKNILNEYQERLFDTFIYISYILIILSFFKIAEFAPKYLIDLDYYARIYICLFLIWRFNPFRTNVEFTSLDRKITFNAGLFILTTTVLNTYLLDVTNKIKKMLTNKNIL